jgi:dTDP-4-dehydrorhamnose 3,5-epimerase
MMKKLETAHPEVFILEPKVFGDSRGWFMETYSSKAMEELGLPALFVQDNHSFTAAKGTLRGLHFQENPMAQAKLVRVLKGAVLDVAVDLRLGSPNYLKWVSTELSSDNKRMLYIPRGFAHGFLTLTPDVESTYKVDNLYSFEHDRSIRFDDPEIGVDWGTAAPILSEKDRSAPMLKEIGSPFTYDEHGGIV